MKKILIVEDELLLLKLLHTELAEKGYTVIEATDGKTGLEKALQENPDLILLDIKLPIMDGLTMLDLLRKEKEGQTIKVIILTNVEPDTAVIGKVITDQPVYYFIKSDVMLSDLFDKIKKLLMPIDRE
jgi:DNA-binding response OmpR family regulator